MKSQQAGSSSRDVRHGPAEADLLQLLQRSRLQLQLMLPLVPRAVGLQVPRAVGLQASARALPQVLLPRQVQRLLPSRFGGRMGTASSKRWEAPS
jgi:hypothetical protein